MSLENQGIVYLEFSEKLGVYKYKFTAPGRETVFMVDVNLSDDARISLVQTVFNRWLDGEEV